MRDAARLLLVCRAQHGAAKVGRGLSQLRRPGGLFLPDPCSVPRLPVLTGCVCPLLCRCGTVCACSLAGAGPLFFPFLDFKTFLFCGRSPVFSILDYSTDNKGQGFPCLFRPDQVLRRSNTESRSRLLLLFIFFPEGILPLHLLWALNFTTSMCSLALRAGSTMPLGSGSPPLSQHPRSCRWTKDLNVETINTLRSSSLPSFTGI